MRKGAPTQDHYTYGGIPIIYYRGYGFVKGRDGIPRAFAGDPENNKKRLEQRWVFQTFFHLEKDYAIARSAARRVLRRKMAHRISAKISAMGKASQTKVKFPIWDSSQATGSRITS